MNPPVAVPFKADETIANTEKKTTPPTVMLDLPKSQPSRQPLTDEQYSVAKNELRDTTYVQLQFPKTMKLWRDPPLAGQLYSMISFIPAKGATPDSDGCYGVLKTRGNFATLPECDEWSENIIRNYDSYARIQITYTGLPVPLMADASAYTKETREIDIRKKIDTEMREKLKKARDQEKQEMEEVQERVRMLKQSVDDVKQERPEDLDFYVTLKVKRAHALHMIEENEKNIISAKKTAEDADKELAALDEKYPEYKSSYLEKYTKALESVGTKPNDSSLMKFMK